MTCTQQILILGVCYLGERKSKVVIAGKKILQVRSMEERKSESVIANENSMEESKSEIVHKSINTNKEKYAIDETKYEEHLVTENLVINDLIYFNLFKCGKTFSDNVYATCERACMETSKDTYYINMCNNLTDYNDRNNTPLSNTNI